MRGQVVVNLDVEKRASMIVKRRRRRYKSQGEKEMGKQREAVGKR